MKGPDRQKQTQEQNKRSGQARLVYVKNMKETFIKRYVVKRTNAAEITPEGDLS